MRVQSVFSELQSSKEETWSWHYIGSPMPTRPDRPIGQLTVAMALPACQAGKHAGQPWCLRVAGRTHKHDPKSFSSALNGTLKLTV